MKRSISTLLFGLGLLSSMQAQKNQLQEPVLVTSQENFLSPDKAIIEEGADELHGAELFIAGVDPALIKVDDGLVIWPVPSTDVLHIFSAGNNSGNMPFEIVSMSGRVVLRGSIQGGSANLIEVEDLAAGDHLLRVVDGRSIKQIVFSRNP